jgi:signal transduction histidine kinase
MNPDPAVLLDSIRSSVQKVLEQIPAETDTRSDWLEQVLETVCSPIDVLYEQVNQLESTNDLLRVENERFKGLQEFRYRFEVALRNSPITVLTMDRDLRINWIFNLPPGLKEEFVIGKRDDELFLPEDAAPITALKQEVLSNGVSARKEFTVHLGDGVYLFDTTIEPLRDGQGEIVGIVVVTMDVTQQRRMEMEAVRNLARIEVQRRLIAERELERTRIARDLHDGPLQDLIATSYNLVEAMDINKKEPRLAKMRIIQNLLQKQVQELRRFCNDLRPPVLAPFGLEKTIRSHAEGLRDLYPELQLNFHLERDGLQLPEEVRMTLFRVYQELMNNVLRHSKASEATVHLYLQEGWAVLEVEDNGVGFPTPANWVDLARGGHLGLVGLQERVQMVGGKVEIEAAPGVGTRVRVSVPR